MRLPFFQQNGDGSFNTNDIGDLSIITKYVLLRDLETGSLLSAGLMVTAPTGPSIETIEGNINSTLLQPYLGYRWQAGSFFVHGFSSVVVPTDEKDVTLALNSVGAGYIFQLSADSLLTSITPVTELHVTTPLNHTGATEPISVPDILSITAGTQLGIGERGLLTFGLNAPVTGPRAYDFGLSAYLNISF